MWLNKCLLASIVVLNSNFFLRRCGDNEAGSVCLAESGVDARFYDFTVTATDSSGNVGEATCTVVAVPEYYPEGKGKGKGKGSSSNSGSSGKSSKKAQPDRPTRFKLIRQLNGSEQRYVLEEIDLVWNTGGDNAMVPPAERPTYGSKSSKSSRSKKASKSAVLV